MRKRPGSNPGTMGTNLKAERYDHCATCPVNLTSPAACLLKGAMQCPTPPVSCFTVPWDTRSRDEKVAAVPSAYTATAANGALQHHRTCRRKALLATAGARVVCCLLTRGLHPPKRRAPRLRAAATGRVGVIDIGCPECNKNPMAWHQVEA